VRWAKMLDEKGYKEGEAVLRFKSDLNNPNPALRDFPLARVNLTKHPRVGNKYRVWPLMNLAVTVDDIEYNMTHIIRAKDHMDNAKRQELIYNALGLSNLIPVTIFLGRYNFTDMEISCTKTKKLIKEGKFSGWDDVRLPFIAALRKRGYLREAFILMAEQRGLSDVDKVLSKQNYFAVLDEFNRKVLHETAKKANFSENKKGKFKIVMPDNKKLKFNTEIKPKASSIYYFPGFGYARYEGKEKLFYFTHK
jgi:glutamyl-tRNA synthetase